MGDLRFQPILRGAIGGVLAGLAPASGGPLLMLSALALLWSVADQRRAAALDDGLGVLEEVADGSETRLWVEDRVLK